VIGSLGRHGEPTRTRFQRNLSFAALEPQEIKLGAANWIPVVILAL